MIEISMEVRKREVIQIFNFEDDVKLEIMERNGNK